MPYSTIHQIYGCRDPGTPKKKIKNSVNQGTGEGEGERGESTHSALRLPSWCYARVTLTITDVGSSSLFLRNGLVKWIVLLCLFPLIAGLENADQGTLAAGV